jgi:hypothetical protein
VEPGAAEQPRGAEADVTARAALAAHLSDLLQRRLRELIGPDRFGGLGQLMDWRLGLVDGIDPTRLSRRVETLRQRLCRPDCAMALALNSFLPWCEQPRGLCLAGTRGFAELHFDGRCPTGVRGTPPHIDVIASGPQGVVGATVRVFDYLGPRRSQLSAAYRSLRVAEEMQGWVELMGDGASFQHLDVASLAKIAIGLQRIFVRRPIRLLYLFLEPFGHPASAFAAHRAELERLGAITGGSAVAFSACSFHELWRSWGAEDTPERVRAIAAELAHRYNVVMPRRRPL